MGPYYATSGAGGLDIQTLTDTTIQANGKAMISLANKDGLEFTGGDLGLGPGQVAVFKARSSTMIRDLSVDEGLIDSDYRGTLFALVRNHTKDEVFIPAGSRICQLVVFRVEVPALKSFPIVSKIRNGGFGSTGK